MFDNQRAMYAVDFIQALKHTKGKWAGKPFKLMPWQYDVIKDVYGTVDETGKRQYQFVYLEIPKKNGKALALDTPIPTPDGWATMGELQVGDTVFDENGMPCKVLATTDVMYNRKCYNVVFSDGTSIVADANHNWLTNAWIDTPGGDNRKRCFLERRYNGAIPRVRTTEEIKKTLKVNKGTANNHSITNAKPLQLPRTDLLIPPYTLGVWLGDGMTRGASFVSHKDDVEIANRVIAEGVPCRIRSIENDVVYYAMNDGIRRGKHTGNTVQEKLRKIGVLGNKHIPTEYLRASEEQRRSLLCGLMDTDGYISKAGECEFTTTKETLYRDVMELLRSLGYKPTVKIDDAKINGRVCGTKYRIRFWAYSDHPCFELTRKKERLKQNNHSTRNTVRHIVAVDEVESVPVRCIEVDSKSHLYLAGISMIPTHNSELGAAIALYHLFADGEQGGEIYSCASDRAQASLVFNVAVDMVNQNKVLKKRTKEVVSQKSIEDKVSKSVYKVVSAEAYTKHGLNISCCIFDELHSQPNRDLWDVMTFGSSDAREEPIFFVITTAGDDVDRKSIGWEIHEKARKIISGELEDPRWYCKIWGIEPDYEGNIWDEDLWYQCNPSLGETIDIDKVRQAAESAKNSEAEEKNFRWLRLNQWVSNKNIGWLPLTLWDSTTGKWTRTDMLGQECYVGIDLSTSTDLTALCVLFPPTDDRAEWRYFFDTFIPADNMKEREARDKVPYSKWEKEGQLHATAGDVVDYGYIAKTIEQLATQYKVKYFAADRWRLEYLKQLLPVELQERFIEIPQTMAGTALGIAEIERLMRAGEITHITDSVGRWCFGNCVVVIDGNENKKLMKNRSRGRIDPIDALVDAMSAALRLEQKKSIYESRGLRLIG